MKHLVRLWCPKQHNLGTVDVDGVLHCEQLDSGWVPTARQRKKGELDIAPPRSARGKRGATWTFEHAANSRRTPLTRPACKPGSQSCRSVLRAGSSYVEPDLVVLNPSDYEVIVKTPATTAQLIVQQDPTRPAVQTIWGMQLVVTTQQTAGVALVMSAAEAAVVFWREMPVVKVDPFSSSINNLVNLIGEQRIALGVVRPSAICKVTFTP